jgi:hypothetical protein
MPNRGSPTFEAKTLFAPMYAPDDALPRPRRTGSITICRPNDAIGSGLNVWPTLSQKNTLRNTQGACNNSAQLPRPGFYSPEGFCCAFFCRSSSCFFSSGVCGLADGRCGGAAGLAAGAGAGAAGLVAAGGVARCGGRSVGGGVCGCGTGAGRAVSG